MDKQKKHPSARPGSGRTGTATRTSRPRKVVQVRTRAPKQPAPEVVYTQPQPFNRTRFLLRLATVVAVVLALIFGMSIFFKVEDITVSGAEKYTPWEVSQASGIQSGENLLTISKAKASGQILSNLPYVERVRIGIKLPDTVNIEIKERDVVYAIEANDSAWWLMSADGTVVEQTNSAVANEYTKVLGVQLDAPAAGQKAVAAEPQAQIDPSATTEESQALEITLPVTVKGSERLDTVLTILQYLEGNGVLGQMASVDVSDMGAIELWYADRYQVSLGDTTQLGYKISSMKKAIDQEKDYQSGILDVSFTIWPDKVGYTPFP